MTLGDGCSCWTAHPINPGLNYSHSLRGPTFMFAKMSLWKAFSTTAGTYWALNKWYLCVLFFLICGQKNLKLSYSSVCVCMSGKQQRRLGKNGPALPNQQQHSFLQAELALMSYNLVSPSGRRKEGRVRLEEELCIAEYSGLGGAQGHTSHSQQSWGENPSLLVLWVVCGIGTVLPVMFVCCFSVNHKPKSTPHPALS